jgi:hypothetical protein
MANAPRQESSTLTIRVGTSQKAEWAKKARRAGMSLTLFICYVMDRTDLVVTMTTKTDAGGTSKAPRR